MTSLRGGLIFNFAALADNVRAEENMEDRWIFGAERAM